MYVEARKRLVDWLRRQLIGPAGEGRLGMSPLDRYPTGVLHPVDPPVSGIDPATAGGEDSEPVLLDEQEEAAPADGETDGQAFAQPARRRRYVPPSSVGFSCFVRGEVRLSITCSAAVYREAGAGDRDFEDRDEAGRFLSSRYTRTRLPERTVQWSSATARGESRVAIWEEQARAGVDVRARPHRDGRIVTVTLCNRDALDPDVLPHSRMRDRVTKSLFEAGFSCVVESGELVEYPRVDPSLLTEEEQEIELQYREQRIYAVGHGAAANWDVRPGGKARVWSDFMPEAEVPMMTVNPGGDDAVLRLSRLAGAPTADEPGQFADADASPADEPEQFADADASIADALERFVDGYAGWIAGQERAASELGSCDERSAAGRICGRMSRALDRMRGCVEMLRTDRKAAESFRLANRAMLDQMVQADRTGGKATEPGGYRWRPFQLAFLLTVMVSAIREEDDFRDVLDLIWFPTGGGKTEAYLGLIAFLIVWRRLKYPGSGGGTAAFMRYTLRLLTRQQFERAARMVCALELIRRRRPERLGEAPIDAGIWVGGEISPNRYDQAREVVEEIGDGKPGARYKLLMERCPWCGSPFDVTRGYRATEVEFHFHCTDPGCAFGTDPRPLPCNVVDDALYDHPPSLLIGTIDKFARVAWEERTGAFFGVGTGSRPPSRPPELVIQDELHLVTGPWARSPGCTRRASTPCWSGAASVRSTSPPPRPSAWRGSRCSACMRAIWPCSPRRGCPMTTPGSRARTGSVRAGSTSATWRPCSISSTAWPRSPPCCSPLRGRCSTRTRTGTRSSMRGGPRWSITAVSRGSETATTPSSPMYAISDGGLRRSSGRRKKPGLARRTKPGPAMHRTPATANPMAPRLFLH